MAYLGEQIPKLGFGLMRLPKTEDGKTTDLEQVKLMVDEFLTAGGTYFDTARAYGSSEADIRQALVERYPRESYQLATKNACWTGAQSAEEARAMFDTSLKETGAGYFDFYLIHNIGGNRTAVFDKFEMWDFVKQLKADGKVKHIGLSAHTTADDLDAVLNAHPEMEFVQLQINYADWNDGNVQSRQCLEVCAKHGLPVIIMEPVKGGTLANPPQQVVDVLKEADPKASVVSWALRFCLDVPNIITVLSGMSSIDQMRENITTWKSHEKLTEDQLATLKLAQEKLAELIEVPCTNCGYCTKGCPVNMNIPGMMETINLTALYGVERGRGNYGWACQGVKAGECIQCGCCEAVCPQSIPIISKLEKASALFD